MTEFVEYWVDPDATSRRIDCVAVMPAKILGLDEETAPLLRVYLEARMAERAASRSLRVVGPASRNRIAREGYLSLDTGTGRDRLMRAATCGYRLEQELSAAEGNT